MASLFPGQLHLLTGLRGLRSCHIGVSGGGATLFLLDVRTLLSLTHLTSLTLEAVQNNHAVFLPPAVAHGNAPHTLQVFAAMVNLHRLRLDHTFLVNDNIFGALRQCTKLTHLHIGVMHLTPPVPRGCLSLLQILTFGKAMRPRDILSTMLPLLPMPSLTGIGMFDSLGGIDSLEIFRPCVSGADVTAQVASLKEVARHLYAATRLVNLAITLAGNGAQSSSEIPWSKIADSLVHVAPKLAVLGLNNFPSMESDAAMLARACPGLKTLHIFNCNIKLSL